MKIKDISNGQVFDTKKCGKITIVAVINSNSIFVEFHRSGVIKEVQFKQIKLGNVHDRKSALIYGAGINDVDYKVRILETLPCGRRVQVWSCPYYERWKDMLKRCYSETFLNKQPSYRGSTVSVQWLKFSKFKDWIENEVPKGYTLADFHLDKDLLTTSKIYSETTCVLVHHKINQFLISHGERKDGHLRGHHSQERRVLR